MFHRYSSSLFGIVPSALIITGTRFTLFIFHNCHSRLKNKFNVLMLAIECGFSFIVISSISDRGRTSFYNFLLLSLPTHQIRNWRVDVPFGHLLVFTIENKNQNRLIDKLQKLGNQKGSKYTFSIGRYIFRLSSFIPYDPKLSTHMDEQFLFYKISNLQKREKDVRYLTA